MMAQEGPDPRPEELLIQYNLYLKELFEGYDTGTQDKGGAGSAICTAVKLRVLLEEQLCFPALLSLHSSEARELVGGARAAHAAFLNSCGQLAEAGGDQPALMRTLRAQVETYAGFEEQRILPLLTSLPDVTLREMGLEIQELLGKQGHLH